MIVARIHYAMRGLPKHVKDAIRHDTARKLARGQIGAVTVKHAQQVRATMLGVS